MAQDTSLRSGDSRQTSILSLRSLLIALGVVVLIALAVVFPQAVNEAREAARKTECISNLFFLAFALISYEDQNGEFPPAYTVDEHGTPLQSWRAMITPQFADHDFVDAYDFEAPWNLPANLKLANGIDFRGFTCPSGPNSEHRHSAYSGRPRYTDYVAVVGEGTIFPGAKAVSMSEILDGPENTILLVEIANSKIPWSAPRDLEFDTMSLTINDPHQPSISSPHRAGPAVVFADGTYLRISASIPPDTLKALLTIDGGEAVSRDELLAQGLLKRSGEE